MLAVNVRADVPQRVIRKAVYHHRERYQRPARSVAPTVVMSAAGNRSKRGEQSSRFGP